MLQIRTTQRRNLEEHLNFFENDIKLLNETRHGMQILLHYVYQTIEKIIRQSVFNMIDLY